jgi:hypothetical protein
MLGRPRQDDIIFVTRLILFYFVPVYTLHLY